MATFPEYLNQIEHKIQLLIQKMKFLKRENAEMMEEIIQLNQQIEQYKKNIANLEAQLEEAKSASVKRNPEKGADTVKLKEDIDLYIKEIDNCLEWLQSV
jgi:predicted  nucleic acid-binding Zn-ribbon protein